MTLFEVIIICIVAAMFVATIFMFTIYLKHIKRLKETDKQVLAMTNIVCECRNFLNKLSKHDTIVKINNISGLEKKVGELTGICKNQTNNVTQVRDNLDKTLEDIKMRNNMIRDNHKLLDNINVKTSKMKDDIDKIGEIVTDINKSNSSTTINKNIFTAYEDIKEKLLKIDQQYTIITNNIDALIKGHNKGIDATRKAFEVVNDTLNNIIDNIDNVAKTNKFNNEDIAKISSILDLYREKINYITTYIENATKLKTASKSKMVQTKTTTKPVIKK